MITFDEIMKSLFHNQTAWYVDMFGKIKSNKTTLYLDRNNCTSLEHIEKWLCINDLINIAKYLNKISEEKQIQSGIKYYIILDSNGNIEVKDTNHDFPSFVYFHTSEDAHKAINIIGKPKIEKIFK